MDPRSFDALVLTLGAANGGAVSTQQLHSVGLSRSQIDRRVGRLLTRVATGVFTVGPITPDSLERAALLVVKDGVLSHNTAARLHGLPIAAHGSTIELLSSARTRSVLDGVRIRMTRHLPPVDVTVLDSQPVTAVARTICDLAASLRPRRLDHVMESALASGLVSVAELQACLLTYCRRGREGSALLRAAALSHLDDQPVTNSELERITVRLLSSAGITGWVAQYRPAWHDGIRGTVDFAWPHERVLLEVDGRRWHSVTQAFDEDRRRDQAALAAGWWPIRAGWQQVTQRSAELVEVIRTALDR